MAIRMFAGFSVITAAFIQRYSDGADMLTQWALATDVLDRLRLEQEITARMAPLFRELFNAGVQQSNALVIREVAVLTNATKVPFKYNVDVFTSINNRSVFNGYADDAFRDIMSLQEIDKLKRTILTGVYSGQTEAEMASAIKNTTGVTAKRAQLLARTETQRLREATKSIYFAQPEVNAVLDRVWVLGSPPHRDSHIKMEGLKADSDGYFHSPDAGLVQGPGDGGTIGAAFSMGCKCRTEFRRKPINTT